MAVRALGGRETDIDFNCGFLIKLAKQNNLKCSIFEKSAQIVKRKTVEGAMKVSEFNSRQLAEALARRNLWQGRVLRWENDRALGESRKAKRHPKRFGQENSLWHTNHHERQDWNVRAPTWAQTLPRWTWK
jgi:hypothetical protein